MVYLKFKGTIYSKNTLPDFKARYPQAGRWRAVYRIIDQTVKRYISDFPEIDIYITDKITRRKLGMFTRRYWAKEYRRTDKSPFIVLYPHNIIDTYCNNSGRGLQAVLLHEVYHFKQWLLSERLGHSGILHGRAFSNGADFEQERSALIEALQTRKAGA